MSTTATIFLLSATAVAVGIAGSVVAHKSKTKEAAKRDTGVKSFQEKIPGLDEKLIEKEKFVVDEKEKFAVNEKEEYEKAKVEFVKNSSAFIGIYEPLYKVSIGRVKHAYSVFSDWNVRVTYLPAAKALQKLWLSEFSGIDSWSEEAYADKARKLMDILQGFSVERSCEADFTVDTDTYKQYSTLEGEIIEAGNDVKVISPCWLLNGDTLEKGIIDIAKHNGGNENE